MKMIKSTNNNTLIMELRDEIKELKKTVTEQGKRITDLENRPATEIIYSNERGKPL